MSGASEATGDCVGAAYYTADEIREAEERTGDLLTSGVLMNRAATGVAMAVLRELHRTGAVYGRRVGLVVGAGNNGGDALYAGAKLADRGVAVDAVLLDPPHAHAGGLAALRRAGGRVVGRLAPDTDLVVDAVVGLGGRGPLRPAAAAAFDAVTAPVVAVDLPSGVDVDTGVVHDPSVRAAITVTFGARRNAHLLAAPSCGRVEVVDIGLDLPPAALVAPSDAEIAARWPVPGAADDKYTQGVVGIVAGSAQYPGAAVLSTSAAVAATSGMTRYAGDCAAAVVAASPEVVAHPRIADSGRVQAWVVGPGLGVDARAEELVADVLASEVPVLVDADALTIVAKHPELVRNRRARTLLTPHAGEFARLAGEPVGADRAAAVRGLAAEYGATVLLKGRITLIAPPPEQGLPVFGNDAQASWAATAGAGDVLSGIAGSLLASGREPWWAGVMAARLHAQAALLASGGAPIGASALLAQLRPALRGLLASGPGSQ